jgi:hypothetical protein
MQPATRGGFICVRVGTVPDNDGSLIEQVVDVLHHRLGLANQRSRTTHVTFGAALVPAGLATLFFKRELGYG